VNAPQIRPQRLLEEVMLGKVNGFLDIHTSVCGAREGPFPAKKRTFAWGVTMRLPLNAGPT
jgi:hypothetical protein